MVTRRNAMLAGAGLMLTPAHGMFAFGSKDFWNTKDPSEWNDKEVSKLVTQSPWAKEVSVASGGGNPGSAPSRGPSRSGGGGNIGMGSGAGVGGGGGAGGMGRSTGTMGADADPSGGDTPRIKVTVVWESASPVRLAKKTAGEEPNNYVVSMTGMPVGGDKENIKDHTTLQAKGKDPITPEKIEVQNSPAGSTVLCFFPKSPPLTADDKEVTFTSRIGPTQIKVKFELKDMLYKNHLAV
jgi:hypothetical protein